MPTYTIGLIALLSEKVGKKDFVNIINVYLWFYQIARGIYNILKMARTVIREWENIRKQKTYSNQLSLF